MILDEVWFHIVGSGAKWCHPYIAFVQNGQQFLTEIWRLPVTWAGLEKNPPSSIFALYESGGHLWLKDGPTLTNASSLKDNKELMHAASYWLIDRFEKSGLVTKKSTLRVAEGDSGEFMKHLAFPLPANPYKKFVVQEDDDMEEKIGGKDAIIKFCQSKNWMIHPSDVAINDTVTGRELEEISDRLLSEIKTRTPSGVWDNTRCSHCWLSGEMLNCSECRFSCCKPCHSILKPLIRENEVVCVQCVFEEQADASLLIQSRRPDVNTIC